MIYDSAGSADESAEDVFFSFLTWLFLFPTSSPSACVKWSRAESRFWNALWHVCQHHEHCLQQPQWLRCSQDATQAHPMESSHKSTNCWNFSVLLPPTSLSLSDNWVMSQDHAGYITTGRDDSLLYDDLFLQFKLHGLGWEPIQRLLHLVPLHILTIFETLSAGANAVQRTPLVLLLLMISSFGILDEQEFPWLDMRSNLSELHAISYGTMIAVGNHLLQLSILPSLVTKLWLWLRFL